MPKLVHKLFALITLLTAAVAGYASYAAFLVFLYSGSLDWIRLELSEVEKGMLNAILCLFFFLQHSGMIRRSFRRWLANFIPTQYQGAIYTLASGACLLIAVAFWQGSDAILFEANGLIRGVLRGFFALSMLGMVWGLLALRSVDMFGLSTILKRSDTKPVHVNHLTIRGPYRWVRHPLYLFMIILFWSAPTLTLDRLLFNTLWTLWVVAATVLEERDLAVDFGAAYRDYQVKVPMLIPKGFRPAYPIAKSAQNIG
ncbi:MAG: isoprenylcysteine carboxylmethyltransferase family protein [Deltaproteobacteria bacterium]|nr:isoprenylcysteine carboxylmethyltransferase family protein [Deltaproteobacteria bacterium]